MCDRPPGLLGWAFRPRNFLKNLVLRATGQFFVGQVVNQVVNLPPIGNRPQVNNLPHKTGREAYRGSIGSGLSAR
jgi:hypothetical protein